MRRIGPAVGGAVVLIVAMSIGRFAYTPILPYMRDVDGLSTAAAGWVASANYLGYLLGAATARPLGGAFGLRTTMRVGLVLSVLSTLGMAATFAPPAMGRAAARRRGGQRLGDDRRGSHRARRGRRRSAARRQRDVRRRRRRDRRLDAPDRRVRPGARTPGARCGPCSVWPPPAPPCSPTASCSAPPRRGRRRDHTAWPGCRCRGTCACSCASYACAGFGYVITATYLVLIVRESDLGRGLEVVTWCVVGAFSAVSTVLVAALGAITGERGPSSWPTCCRRPVCCRRRSSRARRAC